jgi:hypothetical protein
LRDPPAARSNLTAPSISAPGGVASPSGYGRSTWAIASDPDGGYAEHVGCRSRTDAVNRLRLLVHRCCDAHLRSGGGAACVGRLYGKRSGDISDLIIGVNIALGLQPVAACKPWQPRSARSTYHGSSRGVKNA